MGSNSNSYVVVILVIAVIVLLCYQAKNKEEGLSNFNNVGDVTALDTGNPQLSSAGRGVEMRKADNQSELLNKNLQGYDDFNSVAQFMALEPEVYENQQEYTENVVGTSGASALSVRDDSMDINPRVGLRLIDYQDVFSGYDSRTVSSEYPDQMLKAKTTCLV